MDLLIVDPYSIKVNEIDNDDKQFGMNLAADLLGSVVYDAQPRTTRYAN